jgi:hypothetical protein
MGEIHDTFRGHTAKKTRRRYRRWGIWSSVVAANCTGFQQWHDLFLHHRLRPRITYFLTLLLEEWRQGFLDRGERVPLVLTEKEWRNMLAKALCLAFFEPTFLSPDQIKNQMVQIGLLAALNGSQDDKIKTKLFNHNLHTEFIAPLAMQRIRQLQEVFASEEPLDQQHAMGSCSDSDSDPEEEADSKVEDETVTDDQFRAQVEP